LGGWGGGSGWMGSCVGVTLMLLGWADLLAWVGRALCMLGCNRKANSGCLRDIPNEKREIRIRSGWRPNRVRSESELDIPISFSFSILSENTDSIVSNVEIRSERNGIYSDRFQLYMFYCLTTCRLPPTIF
jgi:hypothetical protein